MCVELASNRNCLVCIKIIYVIRLQVCNDIITHHETMKTWKQEVVGDFGTTPVWVYMRINAFVGNLE